MIRFPTEVASDPGLESGALRLGVFISICAYLHLGDFLVKRAYNPRYTQILRLYVVCLWIFFIVLNIVRG